MSTIYKVAKRAGVSTATVSRVMSGPTDAVSPATRERVMQAVEDLGYTPNSAAKTCARCARASCSSPSPTSRNPFFALILQGIEDAAHRDGYAVLLGDTQHDETREERYALMLRRKEADGLIFLGHRLPDAAQAFIRSVAPRCAPVVNGCEFSPQLGVPSVHIDNAKAASEAMEHLYRLGHRRIGIVTGPLVSPLSRDRLRGVKTRAKLRRRRSGSRGRARRLLDRVGRRRRPTVCSATPRPPTAIFCFNDEMAIGVLETARRRGVRVPARPFGRRLRRHPLRALPRPAAHDHRAADARNRRRLRPPAVDILRGNAVAPVSVTLPHALTIRSTTAPPR